MSLQYLSDNQGQIIAVQVPIEEWQVLKLKYPELDPIEPGLTEWQKKLIDLRLSSIQENPESISPIESLFSELDRDIK